MKEGNGIVKLVYVMNINLTGLIIEQVKKFM